MYIAVNFNSILLAFKSYNQADGTSEWVGFGNFSRLFYDVGRLPIFRYAFINSLTAYVSSLIIGMSVGLFFSYYIYKKRLGHGIFKVILFAPSVISSIVLVTMFRYFADIFVPRFFQIFGVNMEGLLTATNTVIPTLLFYSLWSGFGVPILMYVGAMNNIPESTVEAAQIDGAKPMREFFSIVLPQIYPTVTVFLVTGVAGIFTNQLNLFSFFKSVDDRFYTVGYYLYVRVQKAQSFGEYPYLSALGLSITCVVAPVALLLRRILEKLNSMEN
jgi:ABC-type sugar transport system permease subunit